MSCLQAKSSKSLPCIKGWCMAIRGLLLLWRDLHNNHGLQFLMTNRLNQDCLENLFSVIRRKGGHGDNPTASQFRHHLRQAMVDSILLHSNSSNCAEDADSFLLTLSAFSEERRQPAPSWHDGEAQRTGTDSALTSVDRQVDDRLSVEEQNTLMYIVGTS